MPGPRTYSAGLVLTLAEQMPQQRYPIRMPDPDYGIFRLLRATPQLQ